MNLIEWSSLAQITIAVLMLIGIIVSLYMSTKALRENKFDRQLRQAPYLAFETGGVRMPIEFVIAGKRIPGFNPAFVEMVFNDIPDDAESIRIKHKELPEGGIHFLHYGKLFNYGLGPALKTVVYWIPQKIKIGTESFKINGDKLKEAKYSKSLNWIFPYTRNIKPGQETNLIWLPAFIEKDFEKKINEAWGKIEIKCYDIFNKEYKWLQSFYLHTGYSEEKPYVHITFSDREFKI